MELAISDGLHALHSLLQRCTVRVDCTQSMGTGFFVAPGLVVTCAHVVTSISPGETVGLQGEACLEGRVLEKLPNPYRAGALPDIALVQIETSTSAHPYVLLDFDDDCRARDTLYGWGYSKKNPYGEALTPNSEGEGKRAISQDARLIKLRGSQIVPGLSGSPLLNERTGLVCGLIKYTRNKDLEAGGYAVRSSVLMEKFPAVARFQEQYQKSDSEWQSLRQTHVLRGVALPARGKRVELRSVHDLPGATEFAERPELGQVIEKWNKADSTSLIVIEGIGGSGKTALAERFLALMPGLFNALPARTTLPAIRSADRVMIFSFYQATARGYFFEEFCRWLLSGKPNEFAGATYSQMRQELVSALRGDAKRTLLVLDGLEAIQNSLEGPDFRSVGDLNVRQLMIETAAGHLLDLHILATTRLPIPEIANATQVIVSTIRLERMPTRSLVDFFRSNGLAGQPEARLAELASRCGHHPLIATIACGYLREFCGGDASRAFRLIPESVPLNDETDLTGDQARVRELQEKLVRLGTRYRSILKVRNILALLVLESVCVSYRFWGIKEVTDAVAEAHVKKREQLQDKIGKYTKNVEDRLDIDKWFVGLFGNSAPQVMTELLRIQALRASDDKGNREEDAEDGDGVQFDEDGEYDRVMMQHRYSCAETMITEEAVYSRLRWLRSFGLVNEASAPTEKDSQHRRFASHVAIREPFIAGTPPELANIARASAIYAMQMQLPEVYRRADIAQIAADARLANVIGKAVVRTREPQVISDLLEIAFQELGCGAASVAFHIYVYVVGGYQGVCQWWSIAQQANEFMDAMLAAIPANSLRMMVLAESAKYKLAGGQPLTAMDRVTTAIQIALRDSDMGYFASTMTQLIDILLWCSTLQQAAQQYESRRSVLASARPNYITEDNRTFDYLSLDVSLADALQQIEFCGGREPLGRYWIHRKIPWIIGAMQVGRLEEAEGLCNLEVSQLRSDVHSSRSVDRARWNALLAEVLARQGKWELANDVLTHDASENGPTLDPLTRYLRVRAQGQLLTSKANAASRVGQAAGALLSRSSDLLMGGLRDSFSASFNIPSIDLLNALADVELARGHFPLAIGLASMALWGREDDIVHAVQTLNPEFEPPPPSSTVVLGYGREKRQATVGFTGALKCGYQWGVSAGYHVLAESLMGLQSTAHESSTRALIELPMRRYRSASNVSAFIKMLLGESKEIKEKCGDITLRSTLDLLDRLQAAG
jgi:hypothetical protein